MNLSEKLKSAIDASGLKKKTVADLAGISPVALSKYLKGEVTPKVENLTKIAKALNLSPSYFYEDTTDVYNELERWKARAMAAEKKLQSLRQVLPLISEANTILTKNF